MSAGWPLHLVLPLVGILGLAVGSFINVVVHRVPAGLSVVRPGSACATCLHPVRERDNIPVLSWLLLRGRCRDCAAPISIRYPGVEAGTAILFILVTLRLSDPPTLAACLVVAGAGVALALIDLEHGRLPFAVTGWATALAAVPLLATWGWTWGHAAASDPGVASWLAAWSIAWSPLAGAGLWSAVYAGIWFATAGRGMGLGDVALAPVLGLVLGAVGISSAAVGLAAGFVVGATLGIVLLVGGWAGSRSPIPHGPFMLVGAGIGLFAGGPISDAYLRLVGLG